MDSKSIIGCFQLIPLFGRWHHTGGKKNGTEKEKENDRGVLL